VKIEHRPQCLVLAAPDGEYASAIDCDCGATYYALTARIADLEAALIVRDDTIRRLRTDLFKARVRLRDILPDATQ